MSSDFYAKAQCLHEEFQKKELHYLKAEKKLNDSLMWKKDLNVPLQEYLRKIHQREKKNEEMYQSIMKQMNDLDHRTDLLCSKIEKLGIFRNIQAGHNLNDTNYLFSPRYIPQTLNDVQNFTEKPVVSQFELNSLKSSTFKTASIQTESKIYCENCRCEIQVSCQTNLMQNSASPTVDILPVSKYKPQVIDSSRLQNDPQFLASSLSTEHFPPQMSLQNSTTSSADVLSVHKNEPQMIDSSQLQNVSFSNRDDNDPQFITSSLNAEYSLPQMYENRKHTEKKSENMLKANENYEEKSFSANITKKSKSTEEILEEKRPSLESGEILVAENPVKKSKNKQIFTESQSKSNDSEINVEVSVSKSDVDSVNHEFDFLESDTAHLSSKEKLQNSLKNSTIPLSDVDKNIDEAANSDGKLSNKSPVKLTSERDLFQLNKEEKSNYRSETSESVSETRSPAISLTDSDSVDEKGSFNVSAAYQSLLGNTTIPSNIHKQVSESETEDEVEKTLASTVQKSTKKAKSSVQSKKDKSVLQSVHSKPISNISKPVSMNKSQSKLSKSTKKVLGIDTSSGSEVEAAVKPFENKKDEDSDEFDFYN